MVFVRMRNQKNRCRFGGTCIHRLWKHVPLAAERRTVEPRVGCNQRLPRVDKQASVADIGYFHDPLPFKKHELSKGLCTLPAILAFRPTAVGLRRTESGLRGLRAGEQGWSREWTTAIGIRRGTGRASG